MDKGKPALALLIGHALSKGKHDPEEDKVDEGDDSHEHLKQIAEDLIDAVKSEDAGAVADLLQEAFECLDAAPHQEGPHEDDEASY